MFVTTEVRHDEQGTLRVNVLVSAFVPPDRVREIARQAASIYALDMLNRGVGDVARVTPALRSGPDRLEYFFTARTVGPTESQRGESAT
jgi:hypothetical protein